MTSSKTLKKIVSIGAALMLALGGSLVATQPANAVSVSTDAALKIQSGTYPNYTYTPYSWETGSLSTAMWLRLTTTATVTGIAKFEVVFKRGLSVVSPRITAGSNIGNNCKMNNWAHGSNNFDTAISCQEVGGAPGVVRYTPTSAFNLTSGQGLDMVYSAGAWDNSGLSAGSVDIEVNFFDSASTNIGTATGSFTLTAPTLYRATLDANGGTLGTVTYVDQISAGTSVSLPNPGQVGQAPTRAGYSLSGWSTNAAATVGSYYPTPTSNTTYFAIWMSNTSQNQNQNSYSAPTVTSQPTITLSGTNLVATTGVYSSGSVMPNWEYCTTAQAAVTTPVQNNMSASCEPLFLSNSNGGYQNVAHGLTLDLTATYYAYTPGSMMNTMNAVTLTGKHVRWLVFIGSYSVMTATHLVGGSSVTSTDSTDVTDITEDQRPLPVWASNIVSSIPTLTKSLVTTGGSVALTGGDYADLKSITIGGKAVAFKIETTGNVNIPVPAGEAGKTADIVIVFGGGTMTVQDGIKYVAQVDVAKVAERPIAIAAGAKKITEAIADQIRQAAFANPKNTHIQCVAYAANRSAKAQAAAKLTAVQACGIAAKANPALKISEVSVIVNKAKARQSAVGIKVYKATN